MQMETNPRVGILTRDTSVTEMQVLSFLDSFTFRTCEIALVLLEHGVDARSLNEYKSTPFDVVSKPRSKGRHVDSTPGNAACHSQGSVASSAIFKDV
jgi:hypothetical protein